MKQRELGRYSALLGEAALLWDKLSREYYEEHGDVGACVLGAGIALDVIPPRCRKPRRTIIIHPPAIAQGSAIWESGVDEVLAHLKAGGLKDVYYWYGMLD